MSKKVIQWVFLVIIIGWLTVLQVQIMSGITKKPPESINDEVNTKVNHDKNEKKVVGKDLDISPNNKALPVAKSEIGEEISINDKQYLIVQSMLSLDSIARIHLLVDSTIENADLLEKDPQSAFRCFESNPNYNDTEFRDTYISVWDKQSNQLLNIYENHAQNLLAGANTCLEIVQAIDKNELTILAKVGDGGGASHQLYSYHLAEKSLKSNHGFRLYAKVMDDDSYQIYHAWTYQGHVLLQIESPDQDYSPLYRYFDESAKDLHYTFDKASLSKVVVNTDKKVEANIINDENLVNYKSGLDFLVDGKSMFVSWE